MPNQAYAERALLRLAESQEQLIDSMDIDLARKRDEIAMLKEEAAERLKNEYPPDMVLKVRVFASRGWFHADYSFTSGNGGGGSGPMPTIEAALLHAAEQLKKASAAKSS